MGKMDLDHSRGLDQMNVIKERLHAFSDGIIAIIITIMVFNIQLPEQYDQSALIAFAYRILIFLISFLIIGSEWMKHCELFGHCEELSGKILWLNILYLFTLSLMPLFTRWIMSKPGDVVPAIAYDAVFLLLSILFRCLMKVVWKQNHGEQVYKSLQEQRSSPMNRLQFLIGLVMIGGVVAVSLLYPTTSIVFFVCLPILPSIFQRVSNASKQRRMRRVSQRGAKLNRM